MFFLESRMDAEKTSAAELLAMEYDVPEIKETGASFHRLQGPYNPLEMRMYGKVHSLLGHIVQIDGDSVNSVMLDDQPGDSHERVLVAANVCYKDYNNTVYYLYVIIIFFLDWYPSKRKSCYGPQYHPSTQHSQLTCYFDITFRTESRIPGGCHENSFDWCHLRLGL